MGAWSLTTSGMLLQITVVPWFPSWHILPVQSLSRGPALGRPRALSVLVLISEGSRVRSECLQSQAQGSWEYCWAMQQEQRDKINLELPWMTVLGGTAVLLGEIDDFVGKCGDGCSSITSKEPCIFLGNQGAHQRNMDMSSGPCKLLGSQQHEQYSLYVLGSSTTGKWDKPWKYLYSL